MRSLVSSVGFAESRSQQHLPPVDDLAYGVADVHLRRTAIVRVAHLDSAKPSE
jgi:hypothetical protein